MFQMTLTQLAAWLKANNDSIPDRSFIIGLANLEANSAPAKYDDMWQRNIDRYCAWLDANT